MAGFGGLGALLGGVLSSPDGKEQVMTFLTSPEGNAAVQQMLASPQGKKLAGQLLVPVLTTLRVPDEVRQSLVQYIPK